MCGIHLVTGVSDGEETCIDRMVACSVHRGPDAKTTYRADTVAIGFNRLEIVGGASGAQPITNEDESIILVANGEIFNHQQLKATMLADHALRTRSDIEVVLHLYEKFGMDFLADLEGQFSFIIFDRKKSKIIFARDRWGITPLFYAVHDGRLSISSSIRSLIESKVIPAPVFDRLGLAQCWYLYGPTPPRTHIQGISQLPPGQFAEFDLVSRVLKSDTYADRTPAKRPATTPEAVAATLTASVTGRLQGDYIPGVYVSGGIDSSIIAALVNRISPQKPRLFSITFTDEDFDESPFQRILAEYLDCDLHSIDVSTADIVATIDDCVMRSEAPLIRTAPIPMMLLSAEVRAAGYKFVLCGEGADELFAGYSVFGQGKCSVATKWEELSRLTDCFKDSTLQHELDEEATALLRSENDLTTLREQEIGTKLSRYLVVNQGDRVAMANGIEQRYPFLDAAVSRLAFAADDNLLLKPGNSKRLLRDAFADLLPLQLINRPKQGYLTPDISVAKALQENGSLARLLSRELCERVGVFNYVELDRLSRNVHTETEARFLVFAYSTHVLFRDMIVGDSE